MRLILTVDALILLGFAFALLLFPRGLLADAGVVPVTPDGVAELRAMYGGFELGFCAFLVLLVMRGDPAQVRLGVLAFGLAIGAMGAARLGGIVGDGARAGMTYALTALELGGGAINIAALVVTRSGSGTGTGTGMGTGA